MGTEGGRSDEAPSHDVELALEAFGHARHGVGDEAPRQTVQLAQLRILARRLRGEVAVGELEVDAGRVHLAQLTFRSLHLDGAVAHLDGDALRNGYGFFADT